MFLTAVARPRFDDATGACAFDGKIGTWPFVESVAASHAGYLVRLIGGGIFFLGMLVMAYNVYMTTRKDVAIQAPATAGSAA